MTKKTSTTKPAKKMVATFEPPADRPKAEALAKMSLRPSINAAAVMAVYAKPLGTGEDQIAALVDALGDDIEDMWTGDMKRTEAMLYGQAHALQAIFMNLARRAASQEYLKQWEAYLRMAMKAQNQCRMTLETLAMVKNPPLVIARQANINNGGQQQVNNGVTSAAGPGLAHARNSGIEKTELLETTDGERLDTRTTGAAGGINPRVETVGAVNRAAKR